MPLERFGPDHFMKSSYGSQANFPEVEHVGDMSSSKSEPVPWSLIIQDDQCWPTQLVPFPFHGTVCPLCQIDAGCSWGLFSIQRTLSLPILISTSFALLCLGPKA